MKYDIFISYRRVGGFETAKHLYDLLVRDGYKVSFDIDTLGRGDFDIQLLTRIEQCKDFILIVDKHTFDKTLDPNVDPKNDWVRCELAHALKHKKNIVPVFLSGVTEFPKNLPDDVIEVVKKHSANHNEIYFDNFYKKLCSLLISKNTDIKKIIICILLLIVGLAATFFYNDSRNNQLNINENGLNTNVPIGHKQLSIIEQHDTIDISTDIPFFVGTNRIDMNSITEQKIALIVQQIKSNETYLASFEVMTAFSPEGHTRFNKEIATERANALADVLKPHLKGVTPIATYIEHSWKDVADKLREHSYVSVADSIEFIIEKESNPSIVYAKICRLPQYHDIIRPIFTKMRYTTCRLKLVKLEVRDSVHKSN